MKKFFVGSLLFFFLSIMMFAQFKLSTYWVLPIFENYEIHEVCSASALLPGKYCKDTMLKVFRVSKVPKKICDLCQPEDVEVEVCAETGLLKNPYCPITEMKRFIKGQEPTEVCGLHKKVEKIEVEICTGSGFLKNPYCPETKRQEYIKGTEPTEVCTIHKEPEVIEPVKTFEIINGEFYINGKKTYLVGVSRREALRRELEGLWYGLSLKWYEDEIIKYKLNYVRHNVCSDLTLLRNHCERMCNNGVIVELTFSEGNIVSSGCYADPYKVIDALKDLPNIIYEPINELNHPRDIIFAKEICAYCATLGLISSAGAHCGRYDLATELDPINGLNSVITVHREWYIEDIQQYVGYGKPVVRNEYFDMGDLGITGVEEIMRESFKGGAAGVNYYGFRIKELKDLRALDPAPYYKYLEVAARIQEWLMGGMINE